MGLERTELHIYKDITAGTKDETMTFTPVAGEFFIVFMEGEAPFDLNCAVKVLFDGDLVWFTKGVSIHNHKLDFVGDGVKQVVLSLDATAFPSGTVLLGLHVNIEQET